MQGRKKPFWRDLTEIVLGAVLLTSFSRAAVAEMRYIPSGSMRPTLEVNDKLIIEKISMRAQEIARGDILVFRSVDAPPLKTLWQQSLHVLSMDGNTPLIKRVVGLPGETIAVSEGTVFINGEPLKESYINEPPFYEMAPVKIPDDHVFMMGDNRNNSADSHVWGPLPIENVIGHALFRFWPPHRAGLLTATTSTETAAP